MRTLAKVCSLALVAASLALGGTARGEAFELTVLHTNDTHSFAAGITPRDEPCDEDPACFGGYARLAAAVQKRRSEKKNVLFLDAGDRWQGTLFFSVEGVPLIEWAESVLNWDALTLGNHEFDLGCEETARYAARAKTPILAANLLHAPGCPMRDAGVRPWIIREVGGRRVGIFGIANDEVRDISKALPAILFLSREDAARRAVRALRAAGADIVIALTHIGFASDKALAGRVSGIDLIVGGHTHSFLGEKAEDGPASEGAYPTLVRAPDGRPVPIVTAWHSGRFLGEITLSFDEKGVMTAFSGAPVDLRPESPSSPAVRAGLERRAETIRSFRHEKVAVNRVEMPDGLDPCREGDCLSGMLTADAFLAFGAPHGAGIAMINGGALRNALPLGEVTRGDILSIHPFGATVRLADMGGRTIREALEHGVSDPEVTGPRLLQTAGLRYAVDRSAETGRRVHSVEVLQRGEEGDALWKALDDERTYRVVLTDYLLRGGDSFSMLRDAEALEIPEKPLDAALLERHLRNLGVVESAGEERIRGMRP